MLVSAFAALCPPASGLQAHSARPLCALWTPGPGPSSSPFLRLLPSEFGGGRALGASFLKDMGLSLCDMGLELGLWVWEELVEGLL